MGGTDQIDADIGAYRIAFLGKKLRWPIINWLSDVVLRNGWALICSTGTNITQLEFRRQLAQSYLTSRDYTSRKDLVVEERQSPVTFLLEAHDMTKWPTLLEPYLTAHARW